MVFVRLEGFLSTFYQTGLLRAHERKCISSIDLTPLFQNKKNQNFRFFFFFFFCALQFLFCEFPKQNFWLQESGIFCENFWLQDRDALESSRVEFCP